MKNTNYLLLLLFKQTITVTNTSRDTKIQLLLKIKIPQSRHSTNKTSFFPSSKQNNLITFMLLTGARQRKYNLFIEFPALVSYLCLLGGNVVYLFNS